jgi:hypothetical protein
MTYLAYASTANTTESLLKALEQIHAAAQTIIQTHLAQLRGY